MSASATEKRPGRRFGVGWLMENTLDGMARRKAALGYLFILPTYLGLLVFFAGPIVASFVLSFYEWNIITSPEFVGLQNFGQLNDGVLLRSFVNTLVFMALAVGLQLVLGLFLAMGVQSLISRTLRYYFRSAFFIPLLTSAASISIVMTYIFSQEFGIVNYYLRLLGLPAVPWLNDPQWALVTVVLVYVWHQLGFTFILFLGGLATIPGDVLDAAAVDGAKGFQRLWYITLPMLSPTILFATVIGIINAIQVFDQPYVMTRGGPGDATRTVVMVIYEAAFERLEIGLGSAIALVLFLVILAITALQFWLSRRWVFYQ